MLRIYLDCCALQRPFDDQRQPRVKVEAEAVLVLLAMVEAGEIILLGSDVLEYEIRRISDLSRLQEVLSLFGLARERVQQNPIVTNLAQSVLALGIQPLDALHLASAEVGRVDFFATTDDKLLKAAQKLPHISCKVVSVLELLVEASL
jgi:predicted nucleic acid-binding protein